MNGGKICAYCGNWFLLDGKRYKYCSDECATLAHRKQARERYRRYYAEVRDSRLEYFRRYYDENRDSCLERVRKNSLRRKGAET